MSRGVVAAFEGPVMIEAGVGGAGGAGREVGGESEGVRRGVSSVHGRARA